MLALIIIGALFYMGSKSNVKLSLSPHMKITIKPEVIELCNNKPTEEIHQHVLSYCSFGQSSIEKYRWYKE